jgi:sec-independent protein translocase protein TatB
MFGIDSSEFLLIAIVALVVIGPKELPGLLRTWGKWMAQMRGMASEFRGHVDEMVRQSDLDEVKKQLTASSGLDLQSLDPTKEIRSHIEAGMAEGEKAIAEGKSVFDNPLAEPESAPQIAVETPQEPAPEAPLVSAAETAPVVPETPAVVTAEAAPEPLPEPVPVPAAEPVPEKPAKAAAE